jgi:hypothetical protein
MLMYDYMIIKPNADNVTGIPDPPGNFPIL